MTTELETIASTGSDLGVKPGTIATINDKQYDLSQLPESSVKLLASVKMAEEEIAKTERTLTLLRAARVAYSQALFAAVKDYPTVDETKSDKVN